MTEKMINRAMRSACARDMREEEGEPCDVCEAPRAEAHSGCFGLVETTAACVALVALVLGVLFA